MARVVVTSAAYLGDVVPFVAPANELSARGHDVTFLTPAGFHSVLTGERFALDTYPLDFSASAMHADAEHERLMRHPVRNQARLIRYWMRTAFVNDPEAVRDGLLRAFAGADAVVTHPTLGCVTLPVAEHLGIPTVVGHLFPMMVPTDRWGPPLGPRSPNIGRTGNRALWSILTASTQWALYDKQVNGLRTSLGFQPVRANSLVGWQRATRTVMLVSPHYYGPAADDWPPVTWAGFSPWNGPSDVAVDPAVDAFVDGGDAPVLVTLGTSAATGAGERFAAIGRGLDGLGLRSLHLVADEQNLAPLKGRTGAFVFAPITHVLPRCRVAVVSGALGAFSTALRFGVPVVIVPQLFDQVWHGRRVERLGVGLMAHTPRGVVKAVARIESDDGFRERAAALASKLAREDSARVTADAVESLLG